LGDDHEIGHNQFIAIFCDFTNFISLRVLNQGSQIIVMLNYQLVTANRAKREYYGKIFKIIAYFYFFALTSYQLLI